MFTEQEKNIMVNIDYQIFNNNINDLYHNNCYRNMFDYVDICKKEGSDLALEAATLIKRAFIILIEIEKFKFYTGYSYKTAEWLSELKKELKMIEIKYCEISESLLKLFSISKIKESIKPAYTDIDPQLCLFDD